jgi:hypothetical protein
MFLYGLDLLKFCLAGDNLRVMQINYLIPV